MLTEFQKQKLKQLFKSFDVDGSGYLAKDDFEAMAQRIASGHGHASGSAHFTQIVKAFQMYWDKIEECMDQNGDRRVSVGEYVRFFERMIESPHGFAFTVTRNLCDALFASADRDDSGTISLAEFIVIAKGYGSSEAVACRAYRMLAVNMNRGVTKEEWDEMFRDMIFGDDPSTPASLILMANQR